MVRLLGGEVGGVRRARRGGDRRGPHAERRPVALARVALHALRAVHVVPGSREARSRTDAEGRALRPGGPVSGAAGPADRDRLRGQHDPGVPAPACRRRRSAGTGTDLSGRGRTTWPPVPSKARRPSRLTGFCAGCGLSFGVLTEGRDSCGPSWSATAVTWRSSSTAHGRTRRSRQRKSTDRGHAGSRSRSTAGAAPSGCGRTRSRRQADPCATISRARQ